MNARRRVHSRKKTRADRKDHDDTIMTLFSFMFLKSGLVGEDAQYLWLVFTARHTGVEGVVGRIYFVSASLLWCASVFPFLGHSIQLHLDVEKGFVRWF